VLLHGATQGCSERLIRRRVFGRVLCLMILGLWSAGSSCAASSVGESVVSWMRQIPSFRLYESLQQSGRSAVFPFQDAPDGGDHPRTTDSDEASRSVPRYGRNVGI
jgi:hypothetical protein